MYYCAIFIVLVILLLHYFKQKTTNHLKNFTLKRDNLDVVYSDMKSGDVILVTDDNYDIKFVYILYKHNLDDGEQIKYINKDRNNYLELLPIINLKNKYKNEKLLWMRLKYSLSDEQIRAVDDALTKFYPQELDINAVLNYNDNMQDFFHYPLYMAKIFFAMGTMNIIRPDCLSDPDECYQEFYKNSTFLQGSKYITDELIELD